MLKKAVESALEGILKLIPKALATQVLTTENATQIIIDLAALEEAFQSYLSLSTKLV